jgi:crotonobetainyl-CoA:carnitine CoA-transferase CaiB-like acyl-CoA transferase
MAGPFAGLLVVEIGQYVVAPVAAMHMAHGGARVIKVEPVGGDTYRLAMPIVPGESRHFIVKNRGKESLPLAIGADGVEEILHRLFLRADVVLTNMSPRTLRRHHLDYESVRAVNPRVVYGTVSAYGHVGAEAELPGMDVVAQARSGLMLALGAEKDGIPVHSEVQAADYATSLLLFAAVSTALFVRERTGVGQKVEVSLLAGALYLQGNTIHHLHDIDTWRESFVTDVLPRLRQEQASPAAIEAVREELRPDKGIRRDAYRVMRTADGAVAVGAASASLRRRFFELVGVADEGGPDGAAERTRLIDASVARQPTSHWVKELSAAGIPVSEVRHIEEILFDEHALQEGLVLDVEHELVGRYRTFGSPIRMSETPFDAHAPSPVFARHARTVLHELGYGDDEIDKLVAAGAVAVADAP